MCLALPVQIIKCLPNQRAIIHLSGIEREISLALVPEAKEGDFVIMHVGYALTKLNEAEAKKNIALFNDMLGTSS